VTSEKLIVSSVEDGLLAHVAADLLEEPEFNIGEMPFHVDDVTSFTPDVGEPGTQGIIESGTGLLIEFLLGGARSTESTIPGRHCCLLAARTHHRTADHPTAG